MRFCPDRRVFAVSVCVVAMAWMLRAELSPWLQHVVAGSPTEALLFETVALPGGSVASRRAPAQTVQAITSALASNPNRADLLFLRAREAEMALDFQRAEADFIAYSQQARNRAQGLIELADFYQRRLQPKSEVNTLLSAAKLPSSTADELLPPEQQSPFKLFERAISTAEEQAFAPAEVATIFNHAIERYPGIADWYKRSFDYLLHKKQFAAAAELLARYTKLFPADDAYAVQARARIEQEQGSPSKGLAMFEAALTPRSSPEFLAAYFSALEGSRNLRNYLAKARADVESRPLDLEPAVRLFFYYQQRGDLPQAHRSLFEFRERKLQAKSAWSPEDLETAAGLFEKTNAIGEAARLFLELHQAHKSERGLAGLIGILVKGPAEQFGVGGGDLTFYRDIASIDTYPGTLNGILSLLFNSTSPRSKFANQEHQAIPYFHRAKAAELLVDFDTRFPASVHRAGLHAQLIDAYAAHGADQAVIARGREFLNSFPTSPARVDVWLAMANAHARLKQVPEELAIYGSLLKELAAAAKGVPLGYASDDVPGAERELNQNSDTPGARRRPATTPRSEAYARVLDRYISRLVSLNRAQDALVVYRAELDRNPRDPGLYERLAEFLNQNRMTGEIENVYRLATTRFQDRGWHHKLARWYLRRQQAAAFDKLTRSIVSTFSGSELDEYFQSVVAGAGLNAVLYRQVNLAAHARFPHDLLFVKNLLNVYQAQGTADAVAYERLLRRHWFYDAELRTSFFELLARTGRLEQEVAALEAIPAPARNTRLARQAVAEAHAFRSHFEKAAPILAQVAASYPAERDLCERAASLARSLGDTKNAVEILDRVSTAYPRDTELIARIGDVLADKDQLARASQYWERVPSVTPGKPDGYLESATVYWDYFRYNDALRVINTARQKLQNPALFAYEAGAILENKRSYDEAIKEYVAGALEFYRRATVDGRLVLAHDQPDDASDSRARARLLRLASRPAMQQTIEAALAALPPGSDTDMAALQLRTAVLEEQGDRAKLAALLSRVATQTSSIELAAMVEQIARRNDFADIRESALSAQIAMTKDPVEVMRLQIARSRIAEDRKDFRAAERSLDAAYRANPQILGVVRAVTDLHWRSGDKTAAVRTLSTAAATANAFYKRAFTLEAARKATEIGQYDEARRLLSPVIAGEPLASDLIAAMADTYARAGRDGDLRNFYQAKLREAGSPEQRSVLRRALIPVLTRMKETALALDQYIEVINRYPEDQDLLREASRYARTWDLSDRLSTYYEKAGAGSPKDARWQIVVARLRAEAGDLTAAIASYARAVEIRPERIDLHQAKAALEERNLQFEQAAATYARLYNLTYKDPLWMRRSAEAFARAGKRELAIGAFRKAFIEDRPARGSDYLEIARSLDQWNWVEDAQGFAGRAVLDNDADKAFVLRLRLRLRDYSTAVLSAGLPEHLQAAASAVEQFYTPEEKALFAQALPRTASAALARAAENAGLMASAATLWHQHLIATARTSQDPAHQPLVELQHRRARFTELAGQLEAYWKATPPTVNRRDAILQDAADAFRLAANPREERRVLALLAQNGALDGSRAARYAEVLRELPDQLIAVASEGSNPVRDAAVQAALSSGDSQLALRVIGARARNMPPVWLKAYTALTGFHYAVRTPEIDAAFGAALGPRTVGEQLASKPDRSQHLVGDSWFPYAERYGEFLAASGKVAEAHDYLAAGPESAPESAAAYTALGRIYLEFGQEQAATSEFERAIQADPNSASAHVELARLTAARGRTAEALGHWRKALVILKQLQNGRLPESFWADLRSVIAGVAAHKQLATVRPEINDVVSTYLRRTGSYRSETILQTIYEASPDPKTGIDWIIALNRASRTPSADLARLTEAPWISGSSRQLLLTELLSIAEQEFAAAAGDERDSARWSLHNYRRKQIEALLATKQGMRARQLFDQLRASAPENTGDSQAILELRIAASTGTLSQLLASYSASPERAPADHILQQAVSDLRKAGDQQSARTVSEFQYERQISTGQASAAEYLGLAEVRLQQGNPVGAIDELRRMHKIIEQPFDSFLPASKLLRQYGRAAEAMEFLQLRVASTPWDFEAAAELASLRQDGATLRSIAANRHAPYQARATAASKMTDATGLGSEELHLLTRNPIDPVAAEKPYFQHARLAAARSAASSDIKIRLLRGALAIEPADVETRAALIRESVAAKQFRGAIGAAEPLFGSGLTHMFTLRADDVERSMEYVAQQFLPNFADRPGAARQLSEAYRDTGRFQAAASLLRVARYLDPALDVEGQIRQAERAATLRQQNEERAPVVSDAVEEVRRVRQRLSQPLPGLALGGDR